MKIEAVPFANIVWSEQPQSESRGETGTTISRAVQSGELRVRLVEFSPGYCADHWCPKGHVVFVLEGSLTSDLEDGRTFTTSAGNCFVVGDNDGRHRARTDLGAKVLIVD